MLGAHMELEIVPVFTSQVRSFTAFVTGLL